MSKWSSRRARLLLALTPLLIGAGALVAAAGARSTVHVHAVARLTVPRGAFEISLGAAPLWLPRSGVPETLTLIAGPPRGGGVAADTAYVGFTSPGRTCAPTPAASHLPYTTFPGYFDPSHRATGSNRFAPGGGAAPGTFLDTAAGVIVHGATHGAVRACVWLGRDAGVSHGRRRAPRSLAASGVLALVDRLFAASVSNLTGAGPGHGGYSMYAFDASRPFAYAARTSQCGTVSRDGSTGVAAATPGTESVAIETAPCSTDASTFTFSGGRGTLGFPIADALNSPPVAVGLGGCELDPLTGATVTGAVGYLGQVGCRVGAVQYVPYHRGMPRGSVEYASVDGGVAEIAPPGTAVDLVLDGRP